jgi:hypothetical protein
VRDRRPARRRPATVAARSELPRSGTRRARTVALAPCDARGPQGNGERRAAICLMAMRPRCARLTSWSSPRHRGAMSGLRVPGVARVHRDRPGDPLVRTPLHRERGRSAPAQVLRLWWQHHRAVGPGGRGQLPSAAMRATLRCLAPRKRAWGVERSRAPLSSRVGRRSPGPSPPLRRRASRQLPGAPVSRWVAAVALSGRGIEGFSGGEMPVNQ